MLVLISDSSDLAKFQNLFKEFLYEHLSNEVRLNFGHLGASFDEIVHTNERIWYFMKLAGEPQANRYWNAFGLYSPDESSNIAVEINFPSEGINRSVAGILARDSKSQTHFSHIGYYPG